MKICTGGNLAGLNKRDSGDSGGCVKKLLGALFSTLLLTGSFVGSTLLQTHLPSACQVRPSRPHLALLNYHSPSPTWQSRRMTHMCTRMLAAANPSTNNRESRIMSKSTISLLCKTRLLSFALLIVSRLPSISSSTDISREHLDGLRWLCPSRLWTFYTGFASEKLHSVSKHSQKLCVITTWYVPRVST